MASLAIVRSGASAVGRCKIARLQGCKVAGLQEALTNNALLPHPSGAGARGHVAIPTRHAG